MHHEVAVGIGVGVVEGESHKLVARIAFKFAPEAFFEFCIDKFCAKAAERRTFGSAERYYHIFGCPGFAEAIIVQIELYLCYRVAFHVGKLRGRVYGLRAEGGVVEVVEPERCLVVHDRAVVDSKLGGLERLCACCGGEYGAGNKTQVKFSHMTDLKG